MKKSIFFSALIVIGILLTSCFGAGLDQKTNLTPSVSVIAPTDTIVPTPTEMPSTVSFFEQTDASENSPQFYLYIETLEDDKIPPLTINCWGKESTVYSSPSGLILNNHCIIDTGDVRADVVLPDGSHIFLDKETEIQVNISENVSQIILSKGEIYNNVAPQMNNKKFIVEVDDLSIEAVGTNFGVYKKYDMYRVFVNDGNVYTQRCQFWKINTCMKWNQVSVTMASYNRYSRIGEDQWTSESFPFGWSLDRLLMPLTQEVAELDYKYLAKIEGCSDSRDCLNAVRSFTESHIFGEDPWLYVSAHELWDLADKRNKTIGSTYCTEYPGFCFSPTAQPTMEISLPEPSNNNPDPSGGGSVAGACSSVPSNIQVDACNCSMRSNQGVWCEISSGGSPIGEGWIPPACTIALGICSN